ncbi:MAG: T9SS type A sorting domain-containing protein [Flavipsychrobacter sp.]
MRKMILLPLLLFAAFNVLGQTTYKYHFDNNLHEVGGHGPDLVASCTAAYNMESLPIGVSKNVFTFDKGCGLTFTDGSGFLSSGSYTVEMYVKLDTIQGYTKLIDYKRRTSDNGFYNQTGKLVLYPNFNSDSLIGGGQYFYIALTRDGSTKDMHIYVNNTSAGSYKDSTNEYIYDAGNTLTFFIDDSNTNHEDVTGAVAMLHISNYAMDSTTINGNYTSLSSTLDVPNTAVSNTDLNIYPNPSTGNVHIRSTASGSYVISDITGRVMQTGNFVQGDNKLDLNGFLSGMYILKVTDKNGIGSSTYKLLKE